MRTTIRLDDDLARKVKDLAQKEDTSFGRMLNRVLRAGLANGKAHRPQKPRFRQRTFDMGQPIVNIDKALALASALDDEETARELAQRK